MTPGGTVSGPSSMSSYCFLANRAGPVLDEQGEVQMDKLLTVTKGAEQDQEIKQLRAQDEAANQKSHFTLDLGVIVSLIL